MERLFLIFEQMYGSYGITGMILMAVAAVAFVIQMYYWIMRYGRIPAYRGTQAAAEVLYLAHDLFTVFLFCTFGKADLGAHIAETDI